MTVTVSVFPRAKPTVKGDFTPTHPVLLNFDSEVNVFMSYEQAIKVSRILRIACGVDLPQEEAAA